MAEELLLNKYRQSPVILSLLTQRDLHLVNIGCSDADVVRVSDGNTSWFIKIKPDDGVEPLATERDVLVWLAPRALVPAVRDYGRAGGYEYLVTGAVPGSDCVALHEGGRMTPHAMVALLAEGLRLLHGLPLEACPFDQGLERKLAQAEANVAAGRVDETDFDPERQGMTAAAIYRRLQEHPPRETALVFNHGDYCLPNIMVQEGRISGFIDLGRAGIADRYNDLAIASRSIAYNLGAEFEPFFFAHYGLEHPDRERIAYYRALDELY